MTRVYTDPRFPDIEVVNEGDSVFHIVVNGNEQETFAAYEDVTQEVVSEDFARGQALEYFNYLSTTNRSDDEWRKDYGGGGGSSGTALAEPKRGLGTKQPPGDDTEVFNNPPKRVGLDDLIGSNDVITQDTVDALIAAARAEADPKRREQLKQQALSAMAQLESLAHKLVRHMLS